MRSLETDVHELFDDLAVLDAQDIAPTNEASFAGASGSTASAIGLRQIECHLPTAGSVLAGSEDLNGLQVEVREVLIERCEDRSDLAMTDEASHGTGRRGDVLKDHMLGHVGKKGGYVQGVEAIFKAGDHGEGLGGQIDGLHGET